LGNADLILGFDLIGAANAENLKTADSAKTVAALNSSVTPTADSIRKRMVLSGSERLLELVRSATDHGRNVYIDATRLAEALFGSHMMTNLVLLGAAFHAGLLPVSQTSLEESIRLNGVDVERNLQAFLWGRKYFVDAAYVEAIAAGPGPKSAPAAFDPVAELTRYQGAAYVAEFQSFVRKVNDRVPALAPAVEKYLYKLMAIKDEYEVARLLTKREIEQRIRDEWESVEAISYNLHPPLLRSFGLRNKLKLGGWFRLPLRALAACKGIRG